MKLPCSKDKLDELVAKFFCALDFLKISKFNRDNIRCDETLCIVGIWQKTFAEFAFNPLPLFWPLRGIHREYSGICKTLWLRKTNDIDILLPNLHFVFVISYTKYYILSIALSFIMLILTKIIEVSHGTN